MIYLVIGLCVAVILLGKILLDTLDYVSDLQANLEILDDAVNQLYSEIFGENYCDCDDHRDGLTIL